MPWNEKRYNEQLSIIADDINSGRKKPYDYMLEYKKAVNTDDFERCKAITEILKPLNYDTADTHNHIEKLNPPQKAL